MLTEAFCACSLGPSRPSVRSGSPGRARRAVRARGFSRASAKSRLRALRAKVARGPGISRIRKLMVRKLQLFEILLVCLDNEPGSGRPIYTVTYSPSIFHLSPSGAEDTSPRTDASMAGR